MTTPFRARLPMLAAVLCAAALAGSAWTREAPRTAQFVCASGERFSVDYFPRHVRLRTGSGVFALVAVAGAGGTRYSDGSTVFSLRGDAARLERPGYGPADECRAQTSL